MDLALIFSLISLGIVVGLTMYMIISFLKWYHKQKQIEDAFSKLKPEDFPWITPDGFGDSDNKRK